MIYRHLILSLLFFSFFVNSDLQAQKKGEFKDTRDDQIYKTVKIGEQIWMAENLNYQTNNGSWCYDEKSSNCEIYGSLYNWETAKDACPNGWHLPSDDEWTELTDTLGGDAVAGAKLRERGTENWKNPNMSATNTSGFTALPGGIGTTEGYSSLTFAGYWWSGTENNTANAWFRSVDFANKSVFRDIRNKNLRLSVRCVKDQKQRSQSWFKSIFKKN